MLKLIMFLIFLTPMCFMNNMFWMVKIMLFIMSFIIIIMNNFLNYWTSMSYFLGMDMLS